MAMEMSLKDQQEFLEEFRIVSHWWMAVVMSRAGKNPGTSDLTGFEKDVKKARDAAGHVYSILKYMVDHEREGATA